MVNRVHPDTYRAYYPQFSKRSLDKALREIEAEQGWKHSHGLYRWDEGLRQAVRNTPEQMRELRDYSVHVTGSDQLKREIATAAAKHGLNVRFSEYQMNQWLKMDVSNPLCKRP